MARLAGGARGLTRDAPRNHRPPPYVRLLRRSGSIAIWQVDGAFVRKNIAAEFGNFGHHYSFGEIPRDEVWLDAEQQLDEEQFFIRRAVTERRLMARGMDYEAARAVAIAEERRVHAHAGEVSRSPAGAAAYGDGLSD